MALLVAALIRRHLKHSSAFTAHKDGSTEPSLANMKPGESLVGWYHNPAPWENASVAFTDKAIYTIEDRQTVRTAFEDITGYQIPTSKQNVAGIRIQTRDGIRFIRMAGSYGPAGKYKDAFSLIMILRAIIYVNFKNTPKS